MSQTEAPILLEHRYALMREIVASYRIRLKKMEEEVVSLFASDQLSAISEKIEEKQRISRLIHKLEQFIGKWEALAEMTIDSPK